jgi:hypothetical protein
MAEHGHNVRGVKIGIPLYAGKLLTAGAGIVTRGISAWTLQEFGRYASRDVLLQPRRIMELGLGCEEIWCACEELMSSNRRG